VPDETITPESPASAVEYWEMIADALHRDGWSWGCMGYITQRSFTESNNH